MEKRESLRGIFGGGPGNVAVFVFLVGLGRGQCTVAFVGVPSALQAEPFWVPFTWLPLFDFTIDAYRYADLQVGIGIGLRY